MLADCGVRLDYALRMVEKGVEQDPENGAYLDSLPGSTLRWANMRFPKPTCARQANGCRPTRPSARHLGDLYEKTGRLKMAETQGEQSLKEYSRTVAADAEPADISKVQKKLDTARIKLAKGESMSASPNQ